MGFFQNLLHLMLHIRIGADEILKHVEIGFFGVQ
jgi:hypothetical protein